MKKNLKIVIGIIGAVVVILTLMLIFNPQTIGAWYRPSPPPCHCPSSGSTGGPYCSGNSVVQKYVSYSCVSGSCRPSYSTRLVKTCPYGQTCSGSTCISSCTNECSSGAKACLGESSYKICGNYDSDSCLEWSSAMSCPSGQRCSGGTCITIQCTNECAGGAKECIAGSTASYRACGNYDSDSCMEWSSAANCLAGQICSNGICTAQPSANATA